MNILILYGGRSTEHEVSLVSAAGVSRELADVPGMNLLLAGITREGRWYRQDVAAQLEAARSAGRLSIKPDPAHNIVVVPGGGLALSRGTPLAVDCVFPVLHGTFGEDGTAQGLLEVAGLPYVGSGVTGSALGMDKLRAKQLWERNGLPVVPYVVVRENDPARSDPATIDRQVRATIGYPLFVKPNASGSSVGISRVSGRDGLEDAIHRALVVDSTVLLETAYPIREIETSVLGAHPPRAFPPGEVIPSHLFYDYDAKYTDPDGARLVVPADLPGETGEEIRALSIRAFEALDCSGMARVDCFLHTGTGAVYLNEINTIPGFTPISMYPKMVVSDGVPYRDLLRELIDLAMKRHQTHRGRSYTTR